MSQRYQSGALAVGRVLQRRVANERPSLGRQQIAFQLRVKLPRCHLAVEEHSAGTPSETQRTVGGDEAGEVRSVRALKGGAVLLAS